MKRTRSQVVSPRAEKMSGEFFRFSGLARGDVPALNECAGKGACGRDLPQLEGGEGGVLFREEEGDIPAVEFGETGFGELGDQCGIVAVAADVGEDQMLRIRGKEFL